jgi:hypothetical protein
MAAYSRNSVAAEAYPSLNINGDAYFVCTTVVPRYRCAERRSTTSRDRPEILLNHDGVWVFLYGIFSERFSSARDILFSMSDLNGSQLERLRIGLEELFWEPPRFQMFLRQKLEKNLFNYASATDPMPIVYFRTTTEE